MHAGNANGARDIDLEGALLEEERQIMHASLSSLSELLLLAEDREKINTTRLSCLLTVIADRMEPPEAL
ncbi:MAG: hypothetical protein AAGE37_08690 [Pseudomonadota bacterium]